MNRFLAITLSLLLSIPVLAAPSNVGAAHKRAIVHHQNFARPALAPAALAHSAATRGLGHVYTFKSWATIGFPFLGWLFFSSLAQAQGWGTMMGVADRYDVVFYAYIFTFWVALWAMVNGILHILPSADALVREGSEPLNAELRQMSPWKAVGLHAALPGYWFAMWAEECLGHAKAFEYFFPDKAHEIRVSLVRGIVYIPHFKRDRIHLAISQRDDDYLLKAILVLQAGKKKLRVFHWSLYLFQAGIFALHFIGFLANKQDGAPLSSMDWGVGVSFFVAEYLRRALDMALGRHVVGKDEELIRELDAERRWIRMRENNGFATLREVIAALGEGPLMMSLPDNRVVMLRRHSDAWQRAMDLMIVLNAIDRRLYDYIKAGLAPVNRPEIVESPLRRAA